MQLSMILWRYALLFGLATNFAVSGKYIWQQDENRIEDDKSKQNTTDGSQHKHVRHRRNARQHREFLWRTRVVPYEIAYSLRKHKKFILDSIKEIEQKSCLKFVKKGLKHKNWIRFELGDGCSSSVGKTYWRTGAQTIILDYACMQQSTILHEILHALGFWHEHSRPDRNKNIEIFWENIDTINEINFEKFKYHEVDTLGIQYDLKSVMHYGNFAFSKNAKQTLRAINDRTLELGNSKGLSALDVVKINALYDCSNPISPKKHFLSSWSDWSSCDSSCYKQRQRFCMANDLEKCKIVNKHGVETQYQICSLAECLAPVDGHWGRWSSWSTCSVTCGKGQRFRSRKCTDPVPRHGGKSCQGKNTDTIACKRRQCHLGPLDCDFESGSCHWHNEPTNYLFYWQRRSGDTPSRFTGPNKDHTTGKGHYLYTESSFPASKGMVARFTSPEFHPQSHLDEKCMIFWVSLNGAKIGTLNLKQVFTRKMAEKTLWKATGNMGLDWKRVQLTIKSTESYKMVFEASHPGSYLSDFAIDDISLRDGSCEVQTCDNNEHALGLEAGIINDRRMMATSMKDLPYRPEFARLNNNSAWCVDPNGLPTRHYLKVDLGREMNVVSIATQGFQNLNSWVKEYRLFYKKNEGTWKPITYDGKFKIFAGNKNSYSIARNSLPKPIIARYIGINPIRWSDSKDVCLRLELYGCSINRRPNRTDM